MKRPSGRIFVRNYKAYQSAVRKGCSPVPWLKLHRAYFNNYDVVTDLEEVERYRLLAVISQADTETGEIKKSDAEIRFNTHIGEIPWRKIGHWLTIEMCDNPENEGCRDGSREGSATPDATGDALDKIRIDKTRLDNNTTVSSPGAIASDDFRLFWDAYPKHRRRGKPQCESKFLKLVCKDGINADEIMAGLEAAKSSRDWQKDGGKYVPAPHPFLNQHQWEADWGACGTIDESETHDELTEGSL